MRSDAEIRLTIVVRPDVRCKTYLAGSFLQSSDSFDQIIDEHSK